jgi:DUF1680 family protein
MSPLLLPCATVLLCSTSSQTSDVRPLDPVPFQEVEIRDRFWNERIETNRRATVAANLEQCETTGRIRNFAVCGGLEPGEHEGYLYNDSDVYKVLEGVAYTLAVHPDPELEARADAIIAKIASAQQDDGYINTYWTLVEPGKRFTNMAHGHELYCGGHLIEAGVAYAQATGKTALLDVGRRFADYVGTVFGPEKRLDPCGHQELELALMKLARLTGEKRYAELGEFFLRERGDPRRQERYGADLQDDVPALEQREVSGHAVRAMYMYCGMADVARAGGGPEWLATLVRLWDDVVGRKMYVTGGIGNSAHNEGFTTPYDLPNDTAYCETCASVGMALWNHRMCLLTRSVRYADVMERELYNNLLAGVSLSGDRFFYDNPLASDGSHHRVPWFDCSCCPTNVVRTIPAIGDRIWAYDEDEIDVLSYVSSKTEVPLAGGKVTITQESDYPWDGRIRLTIDPEPRQEFTLHLRRPGWCGGRVHMTAFNGKDRSSLTVTPDPQEASEWGAWLPNIRWTWDTGSEVVIELPMTPRRVYADSHVEADRGRVCLMRGPIVYALEGCDNEGSVADLVLPPDAEVWTGRSADPLLDGVAILRANGLRKRRAGDAIVFEPTVLTAVPYALWDNRAPGPMEVWIAEDPALAVLGDEIGGVRAAGRTVSGSHCWHTDTYAALCDGILPAASNDQSIPRHTFWDHRGTSEWLEYRFDAPRTIATSRVYWFDDTGVGRCRVPAKWSLAWLDGDDWRPIEPLEGEYGTAPDRMHALRFAPVDTRAVRLLVELQPEFSAGVLEWQVGAGE